MKPPSTQAAPTRRHLIRLVGAAAGGAASYRAMAALDLAPVSTFRGAPALTGAPKGASVLVLGAGIAGLVAAYELRAAGYRVQVLEYNAKAGGRNWTLRGGDRYTELGGPEQRCEFDAGHYLNPGPWRIPYHHTAVLDYCRRLNVAVEPFTQVNYNAYLHSSKAFGGKPQRFRHVQADYFGGVSELLSKVTAQDKLDSPLTREDQEQLIESLRNWGALDRDLKYRTSVATSSRRGYARGPGGGLSAAPVLSQPLDFKELLRSELWSSLAQGQRSVWHSTIFQPVGGMDQISRAFARELGAAIRLQAKVVAVQQDARGVTVTYEDMAQGGARRQAQADWCVCTIPLSVLSQIDMGVSQPMRDAIAAVPYSPSVKIGAQFKRRFWEEDEQIFGGISYTSLPIAQIGYPNHGIHSGGKGVLLAAFISGRNAFRFAGLSPQERLKQAIAQGAQIHPQYASEFENGISVAWHRVPWALGCGSSWTAEGRAAHYNALCAIDGRVMLAGEHASFIPGWQEGAALSALDAITRLHQRAVAV